MHKLVGAVFAAFLLAACSGTPGSSLPNITVPPGGADAAKTQLCSGSGNASLSGLATKLEGFDPATMDTTEFQVTAGAVAAVIGQLQVTGDQTTLRDAAVTAIQSVQGSSVDKTTATQAAVAIRALTTAVC